MNTTERKMLDILRELKNEHNVLAIKAEFEGFISEKGHDAAICPLRDT